jgi:hypothetical protein
MNVYNSMGRMIIISLPLFADDLRPVNIIIQQLPQTNIMGSQCEHRPQYERLKGNCE